MKTSRPTKSDSLMYVLTRIWDSTGYIGLVSDNVTLENLMEMKAEIKESRVEQDDNSQQLYALLLAVAAWYGSDEDLREEAAKVIQEVIDSMEKEIPV
jgi:hypothetical protein